MSRKEGNQDSLKRVRSENVPKGRGSGHFGEGRP